MEHLEIVANCKGDGITAISNCQALVKAYGKSIELNFTEGFSITIRPLSEVQDLIKIWTLERSIKKGEE